MMSDNPVKHFVLAFLIALAGYLVVYHAIEHHRTRKGPWVVTFRNDPAGRPGIVINQPWLRVGNVEMTFQGGTASSTNSSSTLVFNQPRPVPYDVPFGKCVFMDTTFLPGTLTLQLFGHEIELLPRVLIIDHREYPWQSNTNIQLKSSE